MRENGLVVVDENDNVVGAKYRKDFTLDDISRATALWIVNGRGEILLARRALDKEHDPGKWGPAAAGSVEEDETYESNIIKEAEEELGLKGVEPIKALKKKYFAKHVYFGQWFVLNLDKDINDFQIQKEEVMEIAWISQEQLKKKLRNYPEDFIYAMDSEKIVDILSAYLISK